MNKKLFHQNHQLSIAGNYRKISISTKSALTSADFVNIAKYIEIVDPGNSKLIVCSLLYHFHSGTLPSKLKMFCNPL